MTTLHASESIAGVQAALDAASGHLLSLQSPHGWWKGELQTNVTMDAEDLLLREFLGIRTPQESAEAAAWIRCEQREDGIWATFHGGPANLSTTIEAYVALRPAGDSAGAPHMRSAITFVQRYRLVFPLMALGRYLHRQPTGTAAG